MTDDEHSEDELLARLRAGDPAASLPPADPHRVARLLEDTMGESTETLTGVTESRSDGVRGRGPLTWLVAAAAALLILGGAGFVLLDGDPDAGDTPVAGAPGEPTTTASTTRLTAPAARGTARCLQPSPETLRGRDLAVDATATEVTGDRVTLVPNEFYAGEPTDRVVVQASPAELSALVGAVQFEPGERYLVSATGGQVSVCGFSAPWSQRLADLYAQAFGAP